MLYFPSTALKVQPPAGQRNAALKLRVDYLIPCPQCFLQALGSLHCHQASVDAGQYRSKCGCETGVTSACQYRHQGDQAASFGLKPSPDQAAHFRSIGCKFWPAFEHGYRYILVDNQGSGRHRTAIPPACGHGP